MKALPVTFPPLEVLFHVYSVKAAQKIAPHVGIGIGIGIYLSITSST